MNGSVFGFLGWNSNITRHDDDDGEGCRVDSSAMHYQPSQLPRYYFHMPSGEEVSFCAHEAIGASIIVADTQKKKNHHHKTHRGQRREEEKCSSSDCSSDNQHTD